MRDPYPARPSFRREFLPDYLLRLWIAFLMVSAATLCYAVLGEGGADAATVLGILAICAPTHVLLPGVLGLGLFRGLERAAAEGKPETIASRLRSLPRLSAALVGVLGLSYVIGIAALGFEETRASYRSALDTADFLTAVGYAYVVIPVYSVHSAVSALGSRVRRRLHWERGLDISPRGGKIRDSLIVSFAVVALLPAASLVLTMARAGLFTGAPDDIGYTAATVLILAAGILVTIVFRTGALTVPLRHLRAAAARVASGDLGTEVAVVSDDEHGELALAFNAMTRGLRERERIKDLFGRMVAPEVRDQVLSGDARLGGCLVRATILFSDIRGFTSLSEGMDPERVVSLLNRYFERMTACVQENGGLVNKFVGDAVMALFGVPVENPSHADAALRSALAMRRELRALNAELEREGLPPLRAGIGIHSGTVLAGTIGSSARMEYTVIGDAVNLASRIEGLTKELAEGPLVSAETLAALRQPESFTVRPVTSSTVKGRKAAVELYELLDGEEAQTL